MLNHLTPPKAEQYYHSYLVRVWQDGPQTPWRVLAQSIQSGETIHFADLEGFFAFLRAQTIVLPDDARDKPVEG